MKYDSAHIKEIAGYRLTLRLGSGGMGDVYKAYNAALNRTAAIKILHQQEMADRFRNEAYIQSSVSHPNIARLYEYLVSGDTACIIMEYVDGEPLDVYLHRKGKLNNEETESIVKQIAAALAYLHSKDILHRDIKPQNFKIQADGKITMLDFGISKNKYTPKLTQQGYIVGTTEYMAPEQFREEVNQKSDVWSLGVLTYELLTGYMPFDANNPVTMRAKIEKGEFTKPNILAPQVSEKLGHLIQKSLQVNLSSRISAAQIDSLFNDKKKESVPIVKKIELPSFINRKNLGIAGLAAAAVILIILFAGGDGKIPQKEKVEKPFSKEYQMTIDVPNTSNAYMVFPDGSSQKLPYKISGEEGKYFKFTIKADGFESKNIEVPITASRNSYDYYLEKNK